MLLISLNFMVSNMRSFCCYSVCSGGLVISLCISLIFGFFDFMIVYYRVMKTKIKYIHMRIRDISSGQRLSSLRNNVSEHCRVPSQLVHASKINNAKSTLEFTVRIQDKILHINKKYARVASNVCSVESLWTLGLPRLIAASVVSVPPKKS